MGSESLIKDLKQPSGRIAGRAAMVVMWMSRSRKSEVEFWPDRQNFRQASNCPFGFPDNAILFFPEPANFSLYLGVFSFFSRKKYTGLSVVTIIPLRYLIH
jgi:hypothetical protein